MKKKYFILVSSILASTVLASIGFASWLVTGNTELDTTENDIIVDDITDGRMGITYEWANGGNIVFGPKTNTPTAGDWLINQNGQVEKLTDTLNITITNASYLKSLEFSLTVTANSTGWESAVTDKYVIAPTFATVEQSWTLETDGSTTYALPVNFYWGEAFDTDKTEDTNNADNLNPYTFYNNQTYSDDLATTAYNTIKDLYSSVTGVKFKLTIKANSNTVA